MPTTKQLDNLVINKVENNQVYNYMKNNGLVNEDELYFVEGSGSVADIDGLQAALDLKADKNSPAFTGTPTAPTASAGTNTTQLATTAFVNTEINNKLAANDAMIYKGTLGTGGTVTSLPATHNAGWAYKVITAGTYAGFKCELGDMIICITDGTSSNNAHWSVVQTNIDGAVTGPTSSTADVFPLFDGTTGKVLKNSSYGPNSFVPTSRTVNGKALSANITLSASDVGAASSSHTHSSDEITTGTQTWIFDCGTSSTVV